MKLDNQRWHNDVLAAYNILMFESLIYPHNIISETSKVYEFENNDGEFLNLRGYFAIKETDGKKEKYFIEEQYYSQLPIRVNEAEEMYFHESSKSKSILKRPIDITPFRISAEQCFESNHDFINGIAPFEHTHPLNWTLSKIVAIMGYVGKTFCCVSSNPEFGKSSIYIIMNEVTQKCPVFKPRSAPGILRQITCDGNMVFDDIHATSKEVKKIMENFSFAVASHEPIYINGAIRAKDLKQKYDVAQQSVTYLFNTYGNYSNPQESFWNFLWDNKDAMNSRFLQLKVDGKLVEKFDKDFNIDKTADDNKMFYIKVAKHLLFLKNSKRQNKYQRRYNSDWHMKLKGRYKLIYDEITWGIDLYSESQGEYDRLVECLNNAVKGYWNMIGKKYEKQGSMEVTEEEAI